MKISEMRKYLYWACASVSASISEFNSISFLGELLEEYTIWPCVLPRCAAFVLCHILLGLLHCVVDAAIFTVCERILFVRLFILSFRLYRPSSLSVPADKLVLRL